MHKGRKKLYFFYFTVPTGISPLPHLICDFLLQMSALHSYIGVIESGSWKHSMTMFDLE